MSNESTPDRERSSVGADAPADVVPIRLKSSELFVGKNRDVVIEHAGDEYHLKITRQNKLILTK